MPVLPGSTRLAAFPTSLRPGTTSTPSYRRSALHELTRRKPRRPSPLEIEAAQMAGHIHHLANEVQSGDFVRFKSLGRQLGGVHTACGDLGLFIAFRVCRLDMKTMERVTGCLNLAVAQCGCRLRNSQHLEPAIG